MRTRRTLLTPWLRRRRRTARRRHQYWPMHEPLVPALRGWPVERPRR